jgi:hypothetical protein
VIIQFGPEPRHQFRTRDTLHQPTEDMVTKAVVLVVRPTKPWVHTDRIPVVQDARESASDGLHPGEAVLHKARLVRRRRWPGRRTLSGLRVVNAEGAHQPRRRLIGDRSCRDPVCRGLREPAHREAVRATGGGAGACLMERRLLGRRRRRE